jgi:hypothetical protein
MTVREILEGIQTRLSYVIIIIIIIVLLELLFLLLINIIRISLSFVVSICVFYFSFPHVLAL